MLECNLYQSYLSFLAHQPLSMSLIIKIFIQEYHFKNTELIAMDTNLELSGLWMVQNTTNLNHAL